jgi:hypothetical protein
MFPRTKWWFSPLDPIPLGSSPCNLPIVQSDDLTREQIEELASIVKRDLRSYSRLIDRCNQLGFQPDDPLLRRIVQNDRALPTWAPAADALHIAAGAFNLARRKLPFVWRAFSFPKRWSVAGRETLPCGRPVSRRR